MEYALMKFKKEIIYEIRRILNLLDDFKLPIEIPPEEKGDFAIPCFIFTSELDETPIEIAENISKKIDLSIGTAIPEGPYINFQLDDDYLIQNTIETCLKMKNEFGSLGSKDKKIIIEHTSANPNGPLHVGRARNPIIGDTMARVYERSGYEIERQYFVNDIGRQMAILAWGTQNIEKEELPGLKRDKFDYQIVRYYQKASDLIENDEDIEEEITELIHRMEKGDKDVFNVFRKNADKVLKGISESLERLNIFIDRYKYESTFVMNRSVNKLIDDISENPKFDREEGALYFKNDKNKVFLTRADSTNLYPARDLAYHIWKAKKGDKLLNVLGEDHKSHGEFLLSALKALDINPIPELLFYSFVSFEGKEMSTRKGTYVTLDEFMDTAYKKAKEEIRKRRKDLSKEEMDYIAERVGMGAVRFNIIKVQPEKPIDFRWEEALNFQGDSAPFIQYAYARACGILDKCEEKTQNVGINNINTILLNEKGEIKLIKKIARFPMILNDVTKNKSPHQLAKYALELASEFNQFYRDYPVLDSKNKRQERIALVKASKYALGSVLDTLGICKLESM